MARPSPLPTARPNPFLVARRIVQRQASSATCGWISGDLSKPVICPRDQSCLYDTTSLFIAYCCDSLAGCSTPATACLDSSSASSQCGQESCDSSTLQCTNSDLPFCQTLYWPFSNTLSSFACVSSLTSSFTAYDVYTTTTSEGSLGFQSNSGRKSGAAVSSTTTSPFSSPTSSVGTSSSTPTPQSPFSSPPISTSTSPTSQSPTSTSTALSSSTPHPLPTSVSPFPTSTFDSLNGIAGASLFFLVVISFLLTLILFGIGLLIILYTRRQEHPHRRPDSTPRGDDNGTEGGCPPPPPDTPNGSTASTLPVSGPGPEPSSSSSSSHNDPPPGPYSSSDSTSAPSSSTTRQPTPSPSSAPSEHSSGPASSAPSGPGPLLREPRVGELTSQPSTGMMSDGSGPPDVPPPGLVSLANLHLSTESKPLPEEPSGVLHGNEGQREHAPESS